MYWYIVMTDGADETKLHMAIWFDFQASWKYLPPLPSNNLALRLYRPQCLHNIEWGGGWGDKGIRELMLDSNKIE